MQGNFLTLQSVSAPPSIKKNILEEWLAPRCQAFPCLPPLDTLIISTYTASTPALENGNRTSYSSYLCCYYLQLELSERMEEPR